MIGYLAVRPGNWNLRRDLLAGLTLMCDGTFLVAKAIQVDSEDL